jgi:transposase-like protein
MAQKNEFPESLQQAIIYFSQYDNCHSFMVELRWPDGVVKCPRCGSEKVTYLENARVWKCYAKHERPKFSLKVGTIFEDSPVSLDKWLAAVWMIVNCKNGISSYEIGRALKVTQKTAWFMDHRIRFALHEGSFETKMGGEGSTVEVDETYIGGKSRNMHIARRKAMGFLDKTKTGGFGKVAVFGLLERHGNGKTSRVRTKVIGKFTAKHLQSEIRANVEAGSNVYTDEFGGYFGLGNEGDYQHEFVRHAETYVRGNVHTNGIENFWSLLKRTIGGTYVSVEPFHMFRYLDEQSFRFNERGLNDRQRFELAMFGITDRRLTYKVLTGKQEEQSPAN